jgi:hypothetical protein
MFALLLFYRHFFLTFAEYLIQKHKLEYKKCFVCHYYTCFMLCLVKGHCQKRNYFLKDVWRMFGFLILINACCVKLRKDSYCQSSFASSMQNYGAQLTLQKPIIEEHLLGAPASHLSLSLVSSYFSYFISRLVVLTWCFPPAICSLLSHRFHGALVLTAFVANVAITSAVQCTQWINNELHISFHPIFSPLWMYLLGATGTWTTTVDRHYQEVPIYTIQGARATAFLIELVCLVHRYVLSETSTNIMDHESHAVSSSISYSIAQSWTDYISELVNVL